MTLTSHLVSTDIFDLENVVQQTGITHGKNILIDTLRDVFSRDRSYKYVADPFGYPLTPSHLGLDPDAGLNDQETTRILIGSSFRYDVKFNPAIVVKNSSSRYSPISFNQNRECIVYRREYLTDAYGVSTQITVPAYKTLVGAWDQTFEVKIVAESEADREEIADIVQVALMSTRRLDMQDMGLFIKTISTSGETEEKYGNEYLYIVSVSVEARSEWKVHIPISNVIEKLGLCLTFKTLDGNTSDALSINQRII